MPTTAKETAKETAHWRAGLDTVIAVLRQEPGDLEKRGLHFEDDHDNLDYIRHARLTTRAGRTFALVRHRGAPNPGTELVTRNDSTTLPEDLVDALDELHLTYRDLIWSHPEVPVDRLRPRPAQAPRPQAKKHLGRSRVRATVAAKPSWKQRIAARNKPRGRSAGKPHPK